MKENNMIAKSPTPIPLQKTAHTVKHLSSIPLQVLHHMLVPGVEKWRGVEKE